MKNLSVYSVYIKIFLKTLNFFTNFLKLIYHFYIGISIAYVTKYLTYITNRYILSKKDDFISIRSFAV